MNIVFLIGNGFDMSLGMKTQANVIVKEFVNKYLPISNQKNFSAANQLAQTINVDGIESWSDFERCLGEYSVNFSNPNYGTAEDYMQAYTGFISFMREMLVIENAKAVDNSFVEKNALQCITSLPDFYKSLQYQESEQIEALHKKHETENWEYTLISFNYTGVLDEFCNYTLEKIGNSILGDVDSHGRKHLLGKLIHAHEDIDGIIISGVDNAGQIAYKTFRSNTEILATLIKGNAQRDLASNNDMSAFTRIASANIICIFGMSLGDTDKRWWEAVINRMIESNETIVIIYSFSLSISSPHTPFDRRRIIQHEISKLITASGIHDETNILAIRDRIFVAPSSGIFPIKDKLNENTKQ